MKLILPAAIEAKIHAYVMAASTEIAGFGKVVIDKVAETATVTDVIIVKQEVTGGTADLNTQAIARFQTELVRRGESAKDWVLWWHSHVNMAAFFSGTDTDTMDSSTEYRYLISLVVNKRKERRARLDVYEPTHIYLDNLTIEVEDAAYVVPPDIAAEVAEKLTVKTFEHKGTGGRLMGYGRDVLDEAANNVIDIGDGAPLLPRLKGKLKKEVSDTERAEVLSFIKILESNIKMYTAAGTFGSDTCIEEMKELAGWYTEAARIETNPEISQRFEDIADEIDAEVADLEIQRDAGLAFKYASN